MRRNHLFATGKDKYDTYRWENAIAPSYLNNKLDMGNELKIWGANWYRAKRILLKRKEEPTNEGEIQLLGDYQPFTKPDR